LPVKPSNTFSRLLRFESRNCKTAGGAIILQAVAAWMEDYQLFDPPEEIWETADRLCGHKEQAEKAMKIVKVCPDCRGIILTLEDQSVLCGCGIAYGQTLSVRSIEDAITIAYVATAPYKPPYEYSTVNDQP
jgi:hypothetical protein